MAFNNCGTEQRQTIGDILWDTGTTESCCTTGFADRGNSRITKPKVLPKLEKADGSTSYAIGQAKLYLTNDRNKHASALVKFWLLPNIGEDTDAILGCDICDQLGLVSTT